MKVKIKIEDLWQHYVKMSLPNLDRQCSEFSERKVTFFAAVAETLVSLKDILGDEDLTEEEGARALQDMMDQVAKFFHSISQKKPVTVKEEKEIILPRFRGNVIEKGSAWTWEATITIGPADSEGISMSSKQTFISREAALADMKQHSVDVLSEACKAIGQPVPDDFMDLNAGKLMKTKDYGEKAH